MIATVHQLFPSHSQVAAFLRVGHTGHRRLEHLQASGRLPFRRIVFDAAHIGEQRDLVRQLSGHGYEIVLDPNFAETAMAGRFETSVAKLPWANAERPWNPDDFGRARNLDTAKAVAEFAVSNSVNVVLAPSNLIELGDSSWHQIDLKICEDLRHELDQLGGRDIAIDFQFITTTALLKDERARRELVDGVGSLPIDNIWVRASGFGATATGAGTRHFVEAVRAIHDLDRPLVADGVGGFAGLATLAFGAVGGISHGVAQKEKFDAAQWKRPARKNTKGGGGTPIRVYVPDLDRYFDEEQLEKIFAARRGRSLFGCNDTSCCHNGTEDMIENAHSHFITQRTRQIEDISNVPMSRRAEHFLLKHLDPAIRSAHLGARLKIADPRVLSFVSDSKARLIRLRDALFDLHAADKDVSHSRTPAFRGHQGSLISVAERRS